LIQSKRDKKQPNVYVITQEEVNAVTPF